MKVGIAFDLAPTSAPVEGPDDLFEEFDKPETVEAIARVIRDDGHDVVLLGDGREFLTKVLADPPDFVFNIAEGEGVGRCREARVPAVLEMLGIPCSGSDPLTLAASLDKGVARQLIRDVGRVPRGEVFSIDISGPGEERLFRGRIQEYFKGGDFDPPADFAAHPVILKPCFEGSSKGIRDSCLATSEAEIVAIYRKLRREYHQPILIEEYIEGEEVTVGLVGNGSSVEVIGMMRIVPRDRAGRFVYSVEVKRDWRNRVDYECPARVEGKNMSDVERLALRAYAALGCRDFARIDYRLHPLRSPHFIEANPLPGLAPGVSDLVILAEGHGIGYAELILKIFRAGLSRVGLK